MTVRSRVLLAALTAVWLCACTQTATNLPQSTPVDPVASNSLQLAVGVATISSQGNVASGLNVVETLRQSDGLSGTLFNVPVITGPPGFSIAAPSISSSLSPPIGTLARADVGTNRITQQTFDTSNATGYNQTLPHASSGAFGYGFCACNSNSGPLNGTPQLYHAYYLPMYAVLPYGNVNSSQFLPNVQYYGAPPAFPSATAEIAAAGFTGYSLGFTDFAVAPALGAYRLDVALPPDFYSPGSTPTPSPSASPVPTLSATAQLKSVQGLPPFPIPQFNSDGNGGGTIVLNVPAGATEAMAFIQEGQTTAPGQPTAPFCNGTLSSPVFYSFFVRGSGTKAVTVPDRLGPANRPTLCAQAPFFVYAAGFDYPAFEDAYPLNTQQGPIISNGINGQADVTTSDAFTGTY